MRNPARKIWLNLVLLAVGAALFVTGASGVERTGEDWRSIAVMVAGATLAPIALMFVIFALLHTRGLGKLRAGVGVIARWSVTPEEWEQFRAFDRIRAASGANLANEMIYDEERPSWPVAIIGGRKSAVIGDSYHVLRRGGIPALTALYWLPPPADPECIEFHVAYPRYRSTSLRLTLRFPVPARYRAEGVRVYEHFAPLVVPRQAIALRNPAKTIRIALAVAAAGAAAFAWGYWSASRSDGQDLVPLVAAIVGAIGGATALLIALITAILSRRRG